MNIHEIARVADLLATSLVFGSTVWFFFVQSPALLSRMGREAFVPLQMRLTVLLFRTLAIALLVMTAAAIVRGPCPSPGVVWAGIALAAGLINKTWVIPRALRAGGQSRPDIKGRDKDGSVAGFASDGAGARTRLMHRLVVLFVVAMLSGTVGHAMSLLTP